MVFYIVGLGLGDEKDITVRGLEVVKACSKVWLENYTSILGVDPAALVRARTRARARALSLVYPEHSRRYPVDACAGGVLRQARRDR